MSSIQKLVASYKDKNLVLRIVTGLIIGAILGFAARSAAGDIAAEHASFLINVVAFGEILGNLFVGALKAVAPILVFILILSSIVNKQYGSASGLKRVVVLYIVGTFLASCVGVAASFLFPTQLALSNVGAAENAVPASVWIVLKDLLFKVVDNPLNAIAHGNYVGILTWAIGLGVALKFCTNETKKIFTDLSEAVTKIVQFVIQLAPFGIFGLVASTVYQTGVDALVVNPLIVFAVIKKNPYPLVFTCLRESGLTAFFTRSSAANIPVNLNLCKKLGISDELSSISIPLGATINMAGAAVVIAILALAAAHTLGVRPDFWTALLLCVVSAVGACGASGVPGGSLMLIPLACSLFNISNDIAMQVVAIGFIIGVIQDSVETAINSSTDVIFTAIASQSMQK